MDILLFFYILPVYIHCTEIIRPLGKRSLVFDDIHKDYALTGYVIRTVSAKFASLCSFQCSGEQDCLSFNYYQSALRCEINYKDRHDVPSSFIQVRGAVRYICIMITRGEFWPIKSIFQLQPETGFIWFKVSLFVAYLLV